MRIKAPLLALVAFLFFACEIKEEKLIDDLIAEDPVEEIVLEDEKKPELTVVGFTDIIETVTSISISIVDESTVETKVVVNEEELIVSAEKQFELNINPYLIPIGTTEFTVISTDAKGNEFTENYTTEIKHLLMTYELGSQESENGPQRFVFFNTSEGVELAAIEPIVGIQKIYTENIIDEEEILYTVANYNIYTYTSGSNKNLHLITYKVPLATTRPIGFYNNFVERENTVDVTLNDVPLINGSPDYYGWGSNYHVDTYSGNEEQTTLSLKHEASGPIYLRTNRWGGSTPKFDGKKENYRYVSFTPEAGNTTATIELDQLIPAESYIKLEIPEHDPGTFFIQRLGYNTIEEVQLFKGLSIYDKDSSNETHMTDYIDLPVLPMLNFYTNNLSYSKNGHHYSTSGLDSNLDANMPNWVASVEINDDKIELIANNQEVDYYSVRLNKSEYVNNDGIAMHWILNIFEENNAPKSIPLLSLPAMIFEATQEPYFETTSDLELSQLSAFDYLEINSYQEIVDWQVFNMNKPAGDEYKYRQVGFPISGNSSKFNKHNSTWNLDSQHPYGLDAKGQVIIRP